MFDQSVRVHFLVHANCSKPVDRCTKWKLLWDKQCFLLFLYHFSYLLVFLFVLIIVVCFECQFCATVGTFKASRMKKCEIFQRADTINLINGFFASQTRRFVEIWSIHFVARRRERTLNSLNHFSLFFCLFSGQKCNCLFSINNRSF